MLKEQANKRELGKRRAKVKAKVAQKGAAMSAEVSTMLENARLEIREKEAKERGRTGMQYSRGTGTPGILGF